MSEELKTCVLCGSEISGEGGCTNPSCPFHSKNSPFLASLVALVSRVRFDLAPNQSKQLLVYHLTDPSSVDGLLKMEQLLSTNREFEELFKSTLATSRMFDFLCDQHTARLLILLMVQHYLHYGRTEHWSKRLQDLSFNLAIHLTQEFLASAWRFRGMAPVSGLVSHRPFLLPVGESLQGKLWKPGKSGLEEFLELTPGLGASYGPEEVGVKLQDSESYYESWFLDVDLSIKKHPGYLPTAHEVESRLESGLHLFLDTLSMLRGLEVSADFIQIRPYSYWLRDKPGYIGEFSPKVQQQIELSPLDLRVVRKAMRSISNLWYAPSGRKDLDKMYLLNSLNSKSCPI